MRSKNVILSGITVVVLAVVCEIESYEFMCALGTCTLSNVDLAVDGLYAFSIIANDTYILCIKHAKGNIDLSTLWLPASLRSLNLEDCTVGNIVLPQFRMPSSLSLRNVRFANIQFPDGGTTAVDIRMRNTSLARIPPSILGLVNLVTLELKHSRLRHLSLRTLVNLELLEELNVSYNRIEIVTPDEGWQCCRNLCILMLTGNRLVRFDFGLLLHLPRLASLILAHNHLNTLTCTIDFSLARKHHFCSWRNFFLVIRNGNGTARQPACTDYFASLSLIDLTSNEFTVLEMDTFVTMNVLEDLRTAFNHIVQVRVDRNRMPISVNLSSLNSHRGYAHFLPPEVFFLTD